MVIVTMVDHKIPVAVMVIYCVVSFTVPILLSPTTIFRSKEIYARTRPVYSSQADNSSSYLVADKLEATAIDTNQSYSEIKMKRLPQAIVIGAKKCGTGALRLFLQHHPDIALRADKEINFFIDENKYRRGLQFYRDRMIESFSHQIPMEKSPKYFVNEIAAKRIHEFNSSIKLILAVRDPIQQFISYHLMKTVIEGYPLVGLEEMIHLPLNDSNFQWILESCFHHHHLSKWLKYFNLSQILVVDGENLIKNPLEECFKVEQFLGISSFFNPERFVKSKEKNFYCIHKFNRLICPERSKGHEHPRLSKDSENILKNIFRSDVHRFSKNLGRIFPWTHNY